MTEDSKGLPNFEAAFQNEASIAHIVDAIESTPDNARSESFKGLDRSEIQGVLIELLESVEFVRDIIDTQTAPVSAANARKVSGNEWGYDEDGMVPIAGSPS